MTDIDKALEHIDSILNSNIEANFIISKLSETKLRKALAYLWALYDPKEKLKYASTKSKETSGNISPKRRQSKEKKGPLAKDGKDSS